MKFETYKGNNNEFYFRLMDSTNKILLSSEGYKQKENLMTGIEAVKKNLPILSSVEKKIAQNGKYFFNVKSTNGQVVGTSSMFDSPDLRDKWLGEIQKEASQLKVVDALQ